MKFKNSQKKPRIDLRYYNVPEGEPALVLMGQDWVRTYGTELEDLHFHNLMEVGLCHWGTGSLSLEQQVFAYGEGTVTLIPANCLHTTTSGEAENFWEYLFFDPQTVLQHTFPHDPVFVGAVVKRLSCGALCLDSTAHTGQKLASMVQMILDEYTAPVPPDYRLAEVQQLLAALLLQAARLHEDTDPVPVPSAGGLQQIMPAMEYIGKNYMNNVSVADLAAQCLLSEAHLRRKFKEYLNMTPGEQLAVVRIKNACELLNSTNCQMPEIALRVGYQSVSSFERNFQRIVGMSPYQYKKKSKDHKGRLLAYNISAKKGWVTREDN